MRINDGRYECAHCGATLDVPLISEPRVMIVAASGEPNVRRLTLDGKVIHACEITGAPQPDEKSTL